MMAVLKMTRTTIMAMTMTMLIEILMLRAAAERLWEEELRRWATYNHSFALNCTWLSLALAYHLHTISLALAYNLRLHINCTPHNGLYFFALWPTYNALESSDWIGVNYLSHCFISDHLL